MMRVSSWHLAKPLQIVTVWIAHSWPIVPQIFGTAWEAHQGYYDTRYTYNDRRVRKIVLTISKGSPLMCEKRSEMYDGKGHFTLDTVKWRLDQCQNHQDWGKIAELLSTLTSIWLVWASDEIRADGFENFQPALLIYRTLKGSTSCRNPRKVKLCQHCSTFEVFTSNKEYAEYSQETTTMKRVWKPVYRSFYLQQRNRSSQLMPAGRLKAPYHERTQVRVKR